MRLRGEKITEAIVALMSEDEAAVRVELLKVLARGSHGGGLDGVAERTDPDPGVRLAALKAAEILAQPENAPIGRLLRSSAANWKAMRPKPRWRG